MADTEEVTETKSVFNINMKSLQKLSCGTVTPNPKTDLLSSQHHSTLLKFCDLCNCINLDPLHPHALQLSLIFMCKSKHPVHILGEYTKQEKCYDIFELLDVEGSGKLENCETKLNSMSDWLILLQYIKPNSSKRNIFSEAESNLIIRRMVQALSQAQFQSQPKYNLSALHVSLMALLYTSPRCTPAGKMLENLYTKINDDGIDSELKCLRTMTKFKDNEDDEDAYAIMLIIVIRCMSVDDKLKRSIELVLRQRKEDYDMNQKEEKKRPSKPLLRNYAKTALLTQQNVLSQRSWKHWCNDVQFSVTTSSILQKLLYFIRVQTIEPDDNEYSKFYDPTLLVRAREVKIDNIDVDVIMSVINTLRLYTYNIGNLIDFRTQCLHGVNSTTRQKLHLTQVLQLYIACFQHDSVWERCWKNILPIMNHTISCACEKFRANYTYDLSSVIKNIAQSMLQY